MKKLLILPAVFMLLFAWSNHSYAMMCENCSAMSGMHVTAGGMMKGMDRLGLDEKQTAAVKAIRFRTMKEVINKRAEMDIAEIELRELFLKEPADFKAVEAKVRRIETLRGDLVMLHVKARDEVRSLLTADQRKKFDALMTSAGGMAPFMGCGMGDKRGMFGTAMHRGMGRRWEGGMMRGMGGEMMQRMQSDDSPSDDEAMDDQGDDMPHPDYEQTQP